MSESVLLRHGMEENAGGHDDKDEDENGGTEARRNMRKHNSNSRIRGMENTGGLSCHLGSALQLLYHGCHIQRYVVDTAAAAAPHSNEEDHVRTLIRSVALRELGRLCTSLAAAATVHPNKDGSFSSSFTHEDNAVVTAVNPLALYRVLSSPSPSDQKTHHTNMANNAISFLNSKALGDAALAVRTLLGLISNCLDHEMMTTTTMTTTTMSEEEEQESKMFWTAAFDLFQASFVTRVTQQIIGTCTTSTTTTTATQQETNMNTRTTATTTTTQRRQRQRQQPLQERTLMVPLAIPVVGNYPTVESSLDTFFHRPISGYQWSTTTTTTTDSVESTHSSIPTTHEDDSNNSKQQHDDETNDDDDDDDDDDIDPNSLGDWRAFRMSLAETGILTPEEQKQQQQQQQADGSDPTNSNSNSNSTSNSSSPTPRLRSVSKRNEALLMEQNEELAKEYQTGVWAHKVATPEVGGLVCRLPLEVEIYRSQETIGKVLRNSLGLDDDDDEDDTNNADRDGIRTGGRPSSSAFYDEDWIEEGGSGSAAGTNTNNNNIPQEEEIVDDPSTLSRQIYNGVSPNSAKTVLWYRGASALVKEELKKITDSAENGQIDAGLLQPQSQELLQLYLDNQETWQEVGLVLERDEVAGTATTVAINRPMALQLTENLARMVLFGVFEQEQVEDTQLFVKMLVAFDSQCAIYVGGPDHQDEPSVLVHGIRDLEGAVELSPGSNIYRGGLEAAVEGIMAGKYRPLDFRFFVGRHRFFNHELDKAVTRNKYQPIACARTVALKQCIALPKPLWHEVLELCGGELKELSSFELMKRDDLQVEDE